MTSISTYALTAAPRLAVTQAQSALGRAQAELSSGRLADVGLGLGAGTGTFVALGAQAGRLQAIKDANATTATKLTATTSGLDAMRAAATAFLSSLTAAASAGTTAGALVSTAGANLDALTSTLDTSVGGDAIFAGIDTGRAPMKAYAPADGTTSAAKAQVDASFAQRFGTAQGSAAAGSIGGTDMQGYLDGPFADLFAASNYAGTWSTASDTATSAEIAPGETATTSVSANAEPFRQLAQAYTMVREFGGSNMSAAAAQAVVASATRLVSSALSGLTGIEADVGATQSALSDADGSLTTQIGYLTGRAGDMVGVDPAALSTEITGLQTKIQASYEVTSQLQQLSLVDYLR